MGQAQDDDDDQLVGQTNFGHRSERGTQFVKWCTLHGYMVANTFSAETDQMWTHQNGKNRHQRDYIILSRSLAARFISCDVLSDVDIGSDHRPVQVKFKHLKHQEKTNSDGKPPCVPAKRPHVFNMRAFCWYTRKRFEPTHGGRFEPSHGGVFRGPSRATHT